MSTSKDTGGRDSIASQFTALDRSTWQRAESALLGMIGEKNAKMPLLMTRDEYVDRTLSRKAVKADKAAAATIVAEDEWNEQNDLILCVLSVSLRNCAAARTIIGKYVAGLTGAMGDAMFYADGKAAWNELRETAMGGQGIETAEGYLQEMYRLPDVVHNVDDLLIEHDAIV
jgi:hypothetical protein